MEKKSVFHPPEASFLGEDGTVLPVFRNTMEKLLQERLNEVMPKLRTARDVGPDCTCPPEETVRRVCSGPPSCAGLAPPGAASGMPPPRRTDGRTSATEVRARACSLRPSCGAGPDQGNNLEGI
ncbi:hypothetical protein ANANG_G00073050 [Anguilla anguilla]|uniref:Uncharacterized protein n=1 Tax=Anguilla anguilla TaxID=7936 RepID=A0A9D3MRE8_ANGAN|nr:hypothetical protein ANANG_G00073050 [Anguilla anguilla]